jgi:hypothetical protein
MNLKKFNDDFNGLVSDIPIDKLKEIYYNRTYDSHRTLWIDNDPEGYKHKEEELSKFIDRMTTAQKQSCIVEEARAYTNVLFDLRVMLRSEFIRNISSLLAYNWLIGSIKNDLESYEETNDKYWYDAAKKTVNQMTKSFEEKYWNEETIEKIESIFMPMQDAPELTEDDKEHIDLISKFQKQYKLIQDFNGKNGMK